MSLTLTLGNIVVTLVNLVMLVALFKNIRFLWWANKRLHKEYCDYIAEKVSKILMQGELPK